MAKIFTKVKLYLEANGKTENEVGARLPSAVILSEDGIERWEVSGLAQPTEEQLNSYSAQADIEEANFGVIQARIKLYGSTAEQLEYIVENGVDAFVTKQNQIKSDNPKG